MRLNASGVTQQNAVSGTSLVALRAVAIDGRSLVRCAADTHD